MFRRTRIAVLILSLAIVAVGCGDDDDEPGDSGTTGALRTRGLLRGRHPPDQGGREAQGRHRRAGLRAVGVRRRPDERQGLRERRHLRGRRAARHREGRRQLDPHRLRRGHRPGREGLRLQHPAVRDHPRAGRGRRLLRRLLHGRAGDRRPADGADRRRHLARGPEGRQARRRHRHDEPRLHRGGHPARRRGASSSTTTPRPRPRFDADQVDGIVFDLPTAYFITAVEIPDSDDRRRAARSRATPRSSGCSSRPAARSSRASTRRWPR